jgi:septum formation protein
MTKIILASKSIDRREILSRSKVPFGILATNVNEELYKTKIKDGFKLVQELAKQKALKAKERLIAKEKKAIIVAADTIVMLRDRIIGKAKSRDQALQILKSLQGETHNLITGVAVTHTHHPKLVIDYDSTLVEFSPLSNDEILKYLKTNEWKGRAGAYSIMDKASIFIKSIKGSPSNVIGLPMQKLYEILKKEFNMNLFEY